MAAAKLDIRSTRKVVGIRLPVLWIPHRGAFLEELMCVEDHEGETACYHCSQPFSMLSSPRVQMNIRNYTVDVQIGRSRSMDGSSSSGSADTQPGKEPR